MRELIKKLAIFVMILVLIKLPFVYFYKAEPSYRKEKFAEKDYNAVFIGSSRTMYSVIPAYFDHLVNDQTKSYNFGITSGVPLQTFDWSEEIIQNKPSIKYIFFELSGRPNSWVLYEEPWRRFSFSDYWRGWYNFNSHKFANYHNKLIKSFFKPILQGEYPDYNLPLKIALEKKDLSKRLGVSSKELEFSRIRNQLIEIGDLDSSSVDEEYWQRITNLIEIAEAKNIQIYFFIPPRLETDNELRTVYPLYQRLDEKYKIRAAHFDPSIYTEAASVDNFHLNKNGAMIFTEKLADEFKER